MDGIDYPTIAGACEVWRRPDRDKPSSRDIVILGPVCLHDERESLAKQGLISHQLIRFRQGYHNEALFQAMAVKRKLLGIELPTKLSIWSKLRSFLPGH